MLDDQIKFSKYLQSQGTMTAAEKHLNKRELKNFKNTKEERRTNSMQIGSFMSQSPLAESAYKENPQI